MQSKNSNSDTTEMGMDVNAQRDFIKYFQTLPEKSAMTVRFFETGDCYTVYDNDDCELVARLVFRNTNYIRQMSPSDCKPLAYLWLTKSKFEKALRDLLLVQNYRVQVYVQQQNAATTSCKWQMKFFGSPGNLIQFEDILFANKEVLFNNIVLSIHLQMNHLQRKVAVVAVDQNERLFQLVEFVDDDFLTELEATINILGPKECLIPSGDGEYEAIKKIVKRNGVLVTVVPKSTKADKDTLIQDLNRLLSFEEGQQPDANCLPELQSSIIMTPLNIAIKYLDLVNDVSSLGHYQIQQLNLKRFVHLDAAAMRALHVLPPAGVTIETPSYHWSSILGVLDHCRTPQGHRLMAKWIKQPLRSREAIDDRHNMVQCFLEAQIALQDLHENLLKRLPDILMLIRKLLRKKADLQDIVRLYQAVMRTHQVVGILKNLNNITVKNALIDLLESALNDLSGFMEMVQQVVDFKALDNGEYLVNAGFDEQLMKIKERMDVLIAEMEELQEQANRNLDLDRNQSVRLEKTAHLGYFFRTTIKDDAALRTSSEFEILDVVKGGVRFTTRRLKLLNEEMFEHDEKYTAQQKIIVDEIVKVATEYITAFTSLNNTLAQLDCLVSFAIAAQKAPKRYVRPKLLEEGAGELILKGIRHPCLEMQDTVSYITNDATFKRDECTMIIITGPNMGGKSTYIRSVATAVLMAHVGSFVPCSEAIIPIVDAIFGRVGASDNLVKGLSTFMVEMLETSGIIRTATENSLVIIDELGRGTSTYEGCGIAWSIAEYLAKETKCFTLFATHFLEITQLSTMVKTVKNFHTDAINDKENLTLLYQVLPGVTEKSLGIDIAELTNIPKSVIHTSQNIYNGLEDRYRQTTVGGDNKLLEKMNTAIYELSAGNNKDINESDLTKLVVKFTKDIKELDEEINN